MDEKPAIDLSAVPLSALTAEIKRRMTEFTEAQHMMSGFVPSERPPVAITKRAKHVSNPMQDAAIERWSGWANFKAKNKNATIKEYFAARKAGKA